jgi:hypothetical protein
MRSLVSLVLAALVGAVVASTLAEAGEGAVVSAACSEVILIGGIGGREKFSAAYQAAIDEHLAASRTHLLVVPYGETSAICAW